MPLTALSLAAGRAWPQEEAGVDVAPAPAGDVERFVSVRLVYRP